MSATIRHTDGTVSFKNTSIIDIFKSWSDWRIEIEKKVIQYKLKNLERELLRVQTLLIAIDNLQVIFDAVKKDGEVKFKGKLMDATSAHLMKMLEITEEQVEIILETKIRALTKLEGTKLKAKEKEIKLEIKTLKIDFKNPAPRIIKDLQTLAV
jgi:DNA gyrase/topoisomerase IV subunit A